MSFKTFLMSGTLLLASGAAFAGETTIAIKDAYARSGAKSGAAFFTIINSGDAADTLVSASSDVAPRIELHTHLEDANGVMRMREIEGGITVPAGGMHHLKRGGDHVMFMGLDQALPQGETIFVTLTFEQAGDLVVEIPVDNERKGAHAGH